MVVFLCRGYFFLIKKHNQLFGYKYRGFIYQACGGDRLFLHRIKNK